MVVFGQALGKARDLVSRESGFANRRLIWIPRGCAENVADSPRTVASDHQRIHGRWRAIRLTVHDIWH